MNLINRIVLVITILSTLLTVINVSCYIFLPTFARIMIDKLSNSNAEIIGSADGPTSIMIARADYPIPSIIIPMIITVVGFLYLLRKRKH